MIRRLTEPSTAARVLRSTKAAKSGALALETPGTALVVDSDFEIAATIAAALRERGWHVQTASAITDARLQVRDLKPRVVLVDLWLPDGSGIVFVRELANRADVGIIVVSACNDLADRVVGLELGADHYVAKPFSLRELTARVCALDRRIVQQKALPFPCERDRRNQGRRQTTAPRVVGGQPNAENTPHSPA